MHHAVILKKYVFRRKNVIIIRYGARAMALLITFSKIALLIMFGGFYND